MRTQKELNSFIVLRSNGWSLAKISKHLNIPKTTLFRWEQANAETIHIFKCVQLEKIQEEYVPSYEEQLKDTHEHLKRVQNALKQRDYSFMSTEFLLQMNFQLQTRLDKIRQQVPLRSPQLGQPMEALPPIGCVTRDETFPHQGDHSDPDPTVEDVGRPSACRDEAARRPVPAPHSSRLGVPPLGGPESNGHAKGNSKPHPNGNGHHTANGNTSLRALRDSVVNPSAVNPPSEPPPQNGTFRNENPRGVKNGPLEINDLQPPKRNDRSVLERKSHE